MKKIVHSKGSINTLDKKERIKRVENAIKNIKAFSPSSEAFDNLYPYKNISRNK